MEHFLFFATCLVGIITAMLAVLLLGPTSPSDILQKMKNHVIKFLMEMVSIVEQIDKQMYGYTTDIMTLTGLLTKTDNYAIKYNEIMLEKNAQLQEEKVPGSYNAILGKIEENPAAPKPYEY